MVGRMAPQEVVGLEMAWEGIWSGSIRDNTPSKTIEPTIGKTL